MSKVPHSWRRLPQLRMVCLTRKDSGHASMRSAMLCRPLPHAVAVVGGSFGGTQERQCAH
eukprot:4303354-Amphidinium_carterae.1